MSERENHIHWLKERVRVDDLTVVDFRTKNFTPELTAWAKSNAVPRAESCTRQVWYGSRKDFEAFPDTHGADKMHGRDAYAFLVRLVSGLESKRIGEPHIRCQFFDAWKAFSDGNLAVQKKYGLIVSQIRSDVKLVFHTELERHKVPRREHVARDLSGLTRGDDLLIVLGGEGTSGLMSDQTRGLIQLAEGGQRNRTSFITLTHPDDDALPGLARELRDMKKAGVIRSDVNVHPFSGLSRDVETHRRVYVATSMNDNPEADNQIIAVWQGRVDRRGTLAHLKGCSAQKGESVAPWTAAALDNYVTPEQLRTEIDNRNRDNKASFSRAIALAWECAVVRAEGGVPRRIYTQQAGPKPLCPE